MAKQTDKPTELFNVFVERTDAVDKPATGRKFLILKSSDAEDIQASARALANATYEALIAVADEQGLSLSDASIGALNRLAEMVDFPGKFAGNAAKPGVDERHGLKPGEKQPPPDTYGYGYPKPKAEHGSADRQPPADQGAPGNQTPGSPQDTQDDEAMAAQLQQAAALLQSIAEKLGTQAGAKLAMVKAAKEKAGQVKCSLCSGGGKVKDGHVSCPDCGGSGFAKAEWTAAYINDLPDGSFAYIAPGGTKDDGGKTTPRSLRYLPYKDAAGKPDAAHVRNALSRLPQTNIPDAAKAEAQAKLEAAAKEVGIQPADKAEKVTKDEPVKVIDSGEAFIQMLNDAAGQAVGAVLGNGAKA